MTRWLDGLQMLSVVFSALLLASAANGQTTGKAAKEKQGESAQNVDTTLEINLLRNASFGKLNLGYPVYWSKSPATASVVFVPAHSNAGNAAGVKGGSLRQMCCLAAGEPYRLSCYLRADKPCSFKEGSVTVIADEHWNHRWDLKAGQLDQDWRYSEIVFAPGTSQFREDLYSVIIWSGRQNTEDRLYVSDLKLTPLSAVGKRKGLEFSGSEWRKRYAQGEKKAGPPSPDYKLVWSDEFEGTSLDLKKWKHRKGSRFESPDCAVLDGQGHLALRAKLVDGDIHRGFVYTEPIFSFTYGYAECRIKLQRVWGYNPGFWMLPVGGRASLAEREKANAGHGCEIDIFEAGNVTEQEAISHNLWWDIDLKTSDMNKHVEQGAAIRELPNIFDDWHTVGLEWTEKEYVFYIDGVESFRTSEVVSHVPEYILLSVGLCRKGPNEDVISALQTAPGQTSDIVLFDYVRVYQKNRRQ